MEWILIFLISIATNIEVFACPNLCLCDNFATDHLLDCNTRQMIQFPTGIPEWTTIINFDGNLLQNLNVNQISTSLYLKELRVRYNYITRINVSDSTKDPLLQKQCRHIRRFFFQLYTVDLTGNQLSYLPDCLLIAWSNVKTLVLNRNRFWDFNKLNFFHSRHYSYLLQNLKLRFNRFQHLNYFDTNGPYNALRGLREIDLRDNQIESVESGFFMHFHHLKEVLLSGNILKKIEKFTFVTTGKFLTKIDLSNNLINYISSKSFSGCPHLTNLNLRSNSLQCISSETLSSECNILPVEDQKESWRLRHWKYYWPLNITSLSFVVLSRNKWFCDCGMFQQIRSHETSIISRYLKLQRCYNLPSTIREILDEDNNC